MPEPNGNPVLDFLTGVLRAVQGVVRAFPGATSAPDRTGPGYRAFVQGGVFPEGGALQRGQTLNGIRPTPAVGWTNVPNLPPAPALRPRSGLVIAKTKTKTAVRKGG